MENNVSADVMNCDFSVDNKPLSPVSIPADSCPTCYGEERPVIEDQTIDFLNQRENINPRCFSHHTFRNCTFNKNANSLLSYLIFSYAKFINCKFDGLEFFRSEFYNSEFHSCKFRDIVFNDSNLIGANINPGNNDFVNCRITNCALSWKNYELLSSEIIFDNNLLGKEKNNKFLDSIRDGIVFFIAISLAPIMFVIYQIQLEINFYLYVKNQYPAWALKIVIISGIVFFIPAIVYNIFKIGWNWFRWTHLKNIDNFFNNILRWH